MYTPKKALVDHMLKKQNNIDQSVITAGLNETGKNKNYLIIELFVAEMMVLGSVVSET